MPISASQKKKILQTVNVFETGSLEGEYGQVTLLKDGPGGIRQITYGRSQTTEYGNLKMMLQAYIDAKGVEAAQIKPFLAKMGKMPSLSGEQKLLASLKRAGQDPIMQKVQDEMFEVLYYLPAAKWFSGFRFTEALSLLVIYDSFIHSGSVPSFLRERFAESTPLKNGNERKWIQQYVNTRRDWLENHSNKILRNTVYRMDCFRTLIAAGNWDLSKSYKAHGRVIG